MPILPSARTLMRHFVHALFVLLIAALPGPIYAHAFSDDQQKTREVLLARAHALSARGQYDSARVEYERVALTLRGDGDWEGYLMCQLGIAEAMIVRGRVDSADGIVQNGLSNAVSHLDSSSLALAGLLSLKAYVHTYYDRPDSALLLLDANRRILLRTLGPSTRELAANHYSRGLAHRRKGDFAEAVHDFRRSLAQHAVGVDTSLFAAQAYMMLGNVYRETGDFAQAGVCLDSAMAILRIMGLQRSPTALAAYVYQASNVTESGESTRGLALCDSVITLTRLLYPSDSAFIFIMQGMKGKAYAAMGDYDHAMDEYSSGMRTISQRVLVPSSGAAQIHVGMATILRARGDYPEALHYAELGVREMRVALGDRHPDVAPLLQVLGNIERDLGKYRSAKSHLLEAVAIKSAIPGPAFRADVASLQLTLAGLLAIMGQRDTAEILAGNALRHARGARNRVLTSAALEELADLRVLGAQPAAALPLYDSSLAALKPSDQKVIPGQGPELSDARQYLRVTFKKGDCLSQLAGRGVGDLLIAAHDAYLEAARTLARIRPMLETEGPKFRLQEEYHDLAAKGVAAAARLSRSTHNERYLQTAYFFAEQNKSGTLLESIQATRLRRQLPDSIRSEDQQLRTQLTTCELLLGRALEDGTADTVRIRGLELRIARLRTSLRQLRGGEQELAEFGESAYAYARESLERLQHGLDKRTAVLEYVMGASSTSILVITSDGISMASAGSTPRIADAARRMSEGIRSTDRDMYLAAAGDLYRGVISPIKKNIAPYPHLVIIPDGDLASVPFEALFPPQQRGAGEQPAMTDLPFLIRQHSISYALSGGFLQETNDAGLRTLSPSFAGFAPVFSTGRENVLASNDYARGLDSADLRAMTVDGRKLRELPFSEKEVREICQAFAAAGIPQQSFLSVAATEGAFKRSAGDNTILHVATHGILNDRDPHRSALIFAQEHDSTETDDGILYTAEASDLEINADLVVLSSCESGLGRYVRGEGAYSLTRGFLSAGARNMVFSLWKVMDRNSSELMRSFYEGVIRGESYETALRQAKLSLLARPETAFPFCWAGFVLVGR
jgi:CHAT domain-containing protein/tetratricopeptide (TPR) repeat protein